ncbi:MAG: hypothetical protein UW68_C0051G0007 [Candidatus Collierbacteria bacterium GW2011_GWB1_44_6]|uniref:Uncharacterized protein n=1 Tax=Candidatus Collierbacteria bacterium GW2011_GWB1_44_6 TaxID=1618384 RepID=A0A0G1JK74_9BACT|nr:MAG: hypothetical protein UW68_C0051G0007 [Candidatus Collierbacteria bacterium GW2011_GWB1_44_6]
MVAAKTESQLLRDQMDDLDAKYQKVNWTQAIPFLGNYTKDGQRGINAGKSLAKSIDTLIVSVTPYADLLGFQTGQATPSGQPKPQSIEDRIVFMAQTLDKISPDLEKVELDITNAQKELDQIDPNRYPQTLAGKNIRSKIIEVRSAINESAQLLSQAKPLIKLFPDLLGNPNAKTYMVLFQNDAELRPTGGFMTAYAFLRVTKGKIEPLSSFDIYDLDARFNKKVPAHEAIKKYLNETYLNLRNSNMSPDYKVSMDLFYKYYRDIPGFPKPDGIIAIDTRFPVEILKVIGPIGVGGWGNFGPQNDPACDCPQVVYALEQIADRPIAGYRTGRKAVLGPLMHSMMANAMGSPKHLWPKLVNVVLDSIKQKHLLFYFLEDKTQKVAEDFNAAGRIRPYAYDYLHINDANLGGAKSDMYITRQVEQEIETGNGTVTKTVSISYHNPRKGSNCNLEAGQLCLNGVYRDYVRLLVPKGSKLLSVVGSEVKEQVSEDLDKTVFEAFFTMRPESQSKIVFKYELPPLDLSTYKLLIQKQPGLPIVKHTITLNGNQIEVDVNEDKELILN